MSTENAHAIASTFNALRLRGFAYLMGLDPFPARPIPNAPALRHPACEHFFLGHAAATASVFASTVTLESGSTRKHAQAFRALATMFGEFHAFNDSSACCSFVDNSSTVRSARAFRSSSDTMYLLAMYSMTAAASPVELR